MISSNPNKVALITGASSGIGEAVAYKLAERGYSLVLWARREDELRQVALQCRARGAQRVEIASVDVRQQEAIMNAIKKCSDLFDHLDVVVNNAGLAKGLVPFQESRSEDIEVMIETNVRGAISVTRAALPFLLKKNQGHIVHLGSVAGRWPYAKGHVYCATKAAIHAFHEALRLDLNGTGIRLTEIVPGMVETEFSKVRFDDVERAKSVYQGLEPLKGEDIADAIDWCLSRPAHVNVQEMVLYPTAQASPTVVSRRG